MIENWFYKALISLFLVVPGWMASSFCHKNFGVKPEVFVVWYFLAVASGITVWLRIQGINIWPSTAGCLMIILIGLTFGPVAHILLFRAVVEAPNPGMVVAISGAASAVVFGLSLALGNFFPKYFDIAAFRYNHILGILLVISGVFLLGLRRAG